MDLTKYKLAYCPNRWDLALPGDRRRFVFYAREKNIPFSLASVNETYDIVYLTMGCNISKWLDYKKKNPHVKLVFEITDSYFLEGLNFYTAIRGPVRFFSRKETQLYFNYQRAIVKMLKAADAVVCATPIQKDYILQYNSNVHISLDFFSNDITHYKTDFSSSGKLKLVWEGQSYTANNILYINDVLEKFSKDVELHIITDPEIRYPFKIFNRSTAKLLAPLKCQHFIHDWTRDTFSEIISRMDLAIIPLGNSQHGKLTMNKPENKLLLFWQMGIPTIVSTSPAYKRVMDKAGLPLYCNTKEEWHEKINSFMKTSEDGRKELTVKASEYIKTYHSKEIILKKWDDIFASLFP